MSLVEQIYAQALVLTQDSTDKNLPLLEVFCRSAENALRQKLRDGITPEDCKADFIAAASLYALSALESVVEMDDAQEFRVGDLTVKGKSGTGGSAASNCLRNQAELVITPYLEDRFAFVGV